MCQGQLSERNILFEDPYSKLHGMFCLTAVLRSDRKDVVIFLIRSLTSQQAAANALAVAVPALPDSRLCLPTWTTATIRWPF